VLRNYQTEARRSNNNALKQWSNAQLVQAVYSKLVSAVVSYHRTLHPCPLRRSSVSNRCEPGCAKTL